MYIVHAQNQSTDQMNSGNGICENTKLLVLYFYTDGDGRWQG